MGINGLKKSFSLFFLPRLAISKHYKFLVHVSPKCSLRAPMTDFRIFLFQRITTLPITKLLLPPTTPLLPVSLKGSKENQQADRLQNRTLSSTTFYPDAKITWCKGPGCPISLAPCAEAELSQLVGQGGGWTSGQTGGQTGLQLHWGPRALGSPGGWRKAPSLMHSFWTKIAPLLIAVIPIKILLFWEVHSKEGPETDSATLQVISECSYWFAEIVCGRKSHTSTEGFALQTPII